MLIATSLVSQTIRLNCLVLGELTNNIFGVNIAWTDDVSSLKELIKEKKGQKLDKIDANLLKIWNVSSVAPPSSSLVVMI